MGVAYQTYDPDLERSIALKLMKAQADPAAERARARRLFREAKATAKLSNANVVIVHDVGVFEGGVFLAMEHLSGGTLREWLTARRRPWRDVRDMFVQIGGGLAAAHTAGLVHRDFKPENVLLDE